MQLQKPAEGNSGTVRLLYGPVSLASRALLQGVSWLAGITECNGQNPKLEIIFTLRRLIRLRQI